MPHPSRPGRAIARHSAHRPSIHRIAIVAGVMVAAACAAPPADESATTANAAEVASAPAPATAAVTAAAPAASADAATVADTVSMTVYKEPTCGCCTKWVEHLEEHGIRVDARDVADVWPIKAQLGVPEHLGTCHTAVVNGYVVEGHVPADIIKRMLREKPQIAGIAVPGMPMGSPGMEGDGSRKDRYDVIAIGRDGRTSVYATR